jgi:hypothetical protein
MSDILCAYYVCPSCDTPTIEMDVARTDYRPTARELADDPGMEPIAHEVLRCKCGRELTWFQVRPIVDSR